MSGLCPICKVLPWVDDPTEEHVDIYDHFMSDHQFDYDYFADFNMNEEEMLQRALDQSLYDYT